MAGSIVAETMVTFDVAPKTININTVGASGLVVIGIQGLVNNINLAGATANGIEIPWRAQSIYYLPNPPQMAACPVVVSGSASGFARIWVVSLAHANWFIDAKSIGGINDPEITVNSFVNGAYVLFIWMHRTNGYLTTDNAYGYAIYHQENGGDGTISLKAMGKVSYAASEYGQAYFNADGNESSIAMISIGEIEPGMLVWF